MSLPTPAERAQLAQEQGDSEGYHGLFDKLLEAKLNQLDPEWIAAMLTLYKKSELSRWCA